MENPGRWTIVTLWHALPFVALGFGWSYGTLAALLLVALPYIKVRRNRSHFWRYLTWPTWRA